MDATEWTLDELAARVAEALDGPAYAGAPNGRVRDVPDARAIRWYSTIGLVDDLLLLAKAESGVAAPRTPVDLDDLVKDVGARYDTARVPVEITSDGPLWTAGDPDALVRVLVNLMDNAIRHARTRVRLGLFRDAAHALITVVDDGRGIPEADRKRVFDRFTRLDDARARDAGGTGLGLAIVRELVRRHGGTVTLGDASPGLRVDVRLPVT